MGVEFTAGQKVRALDLLQFPLGVVARNRRTTAISTTSTASGTAQRLMTTGAPVVAGRLYSLTFYGAVRNVGTVAKAFVNLVHTTDGTEPTATSPIIQQATCDTGPLVNSPVVATAFVFYIPTTDHFLNVTATFFGSAGTTEMAAGTAVPTELFIQDLGQQIATSGTVY